MTTEDVAKIEDVIERRDASDWEDGGSGPHVELRRLLAIHAKELVRLAKLGLAAPTAMDSAQQRIVELEGMLDVILDADDDRCGLEFDWYPEHEFQDEDEKAAINRFVIDTEHMVVMDEWDPLGGDTPVCSGLISEEFGDRLRHANIVMNAARKAYALLQAREQKEKR